MVIKSSKDKINKNLARIFMKVNLVNPFIFWSIVGTVIIIFVFGYSEIQYQAVEINKSNVFEKHSFNSQNELNPYEFPNINVELEPENNFISTQLFSSNNILFLLLAIYSVGLSMLFTYRERSRISKEMLDEQLRIEKERIQSKVNIYDSIEKELAKYSKIVTPEFNLDGLDKRIENDVNYILFSSRVVLENLLLKICRVKNIEIEGDKLANLIYILKKEGILDNQTNGFAHTIKAFGNNVAHPARVNNIKFESRDAMLVLSTLVTLLNVLDSQHLLEGLV